uniref:Uncharacterized protein n=1 Tax=Rhizophora mucronata TaxID=61149 RepID=A0A2P2QIU9_RHIMU
MGWQLDGCMAVYHAFACRPNYKLANLAATFSYLHSIIMAFMSSSKFIT